MRAALLVFVVACSSHASTPSPPLAAPTGSTVCYAGFSTGMGQRARTIARRIVDPANHRITEDVSHDDAAAHGAKSFHVVMKVDGDHFTMTEDSGAFSGTGTLVGSPWAWTSWTSTSEIPNAAITVESSDELTDTGMTASKQIKKEGKVVASTTDDLKTFDCAQWDTAKAELALPLLDNAACERACRNFATLKFWEHVDPAADRKPLESDLANKVANGLPACVGQCLSAKNAEQTACLGNAKTVDELGACM